MQAIRKRRHTNKGLSIVEVCMVLVLLGIAFAIGIPCFNASTANSKLKMTARELQLDLDLARNYAKAGASAAKFEYQLPLSASKGYTIKDTDGKTRKIVTLISALTVDYSALGTGNDGITFQGNGKASGGGEIIVRHSGTSRYYKVTLNATTGMARLTQH